MSTANARKMSNRELLIQVCRSMPEVFTMNDLVEQAFLVHPCSFAFRGKQRDWPDKNKVVCYVAGKRGLVAEGWLVRRPDGRYSFNTDEV